MSRRCEICSLRLPAPGVSFAGLTKTNVYSGWPTNPCTFYLLSLQKRGRTWVYIYREGVEERVKRKGEKQMELNDLQFTKKGLVLAWMSLSSASQSQNRAQQEWSQASGALRAILVNELIGTISHFTSVWLLGVSAGAPLLAGSGPTNSLGSVPFSLF